MLRFKARRKSPALKPQGELTASERRVIRLMDDAMQALRRDVQRRQTGIIDAIAHRSADFVAGMITDDPWYEAQKQLQDELYGELLDAGSRVTLLPIEKATLRFSFDRTRPEAAAWARDSAGRLIRQVVDSQREMVRTLVATAQTAGVAPVDVARQIRGGIGLTTAQAGWVDNFYNRALTGNITAGMSPAQAASRAQAAADRHQQQVHGRTAEDRGAVAVDRDAVGGAGRRLELHATPVASLLAVPKGGGIDVVVPCHFRE